MNKILPMMVCAAVMFGCRTRPLTPDECWADYGRYYRSTGETATAPTGAVDFRIVKSEQTSAEVSRLKAQGYAPLGSFVIEDGTDISHAAVMALAQKLNAGAVVWSTANTLDSTVRSNPATGIVGVDIMQSAQMVAPRQDATWAEQVIVRKHEIWMLGKKAK